MGLELNFAYSCSLTPAIVRVRVRAPVRVRDRVRVRVGDRVRVRDCVFVHVRIEFSREESWFDLLTENSLILYLISGLYKKEKSQEMYTNCMY